MSDNSLPHNMTCFEFMAIIAMNLLLFQPILEILIPSFAYFEEVFSIGSITVCLLSLSVGRTAFTSLMRRIALALIMIIAVGLLGNIIYGYQQKVFYAAVDILSCMKFAFVYFAFKASVRNTQYFVKYMAKESKILIILMFICMVINQLFDIGMTYEVRYGLKAFQFIFIHPTHMVTLSLACFSFIYAENQRGSLGYCLISALLMVMSLRSRWIALAFVILLLLVSVRHGSRRAPILILAFSFVAALAMGSSQFQVYYGSQSESARGQLTNAAFDVMERFFPLGTGFGTFGSGVTKTTYSPLYYEYCLDTVYGLAPYNPAYLTDTFWPVVMAQFGFIGLLAWSVFLALLILDFYRFGKEHASILLSLTFIAMLLISTTSSGSIFSVQLITLVIAFIASIGSNELKGQDNG